MQCNANEMNIKSIVLIGVVSCLCIVPIGGCMRREQIARRTETTSRASGAHQENGHALVDVGHTELRRCVAQYADRCRN
jgi:hypothetical protein